MTYPRNLAASPQRRELVHAGLSLGLYLWLGPVRAEGHELDAAVRRFTGGAPVLSGRVTLDISPIVDNGNTVPMTVAVDSPMSQSNHVTDLAVFNTRNPQREVIRVKFTPHNGRAWLASRIRLAGSQDVLAIARMNDGRFWSHRVGVNVAISACLEEVN